jgi:molybdopterin-guanine dinucleotide biosynthesis protein
MIHLPGLVIVAGTGRKVGKTTVACRIIERFRSYNITGVKISSHFHEPQEHLKLIHRHTDYIIWEEISSTVDKDSSRMLASGATRSFYIQACKGKSVPAFIKLLEVIPDDSMIVCESPSLVEGIIPGALIIVRGDESDSRASSAFNKEKDLSIPEGINSYKIKTSEIFKGLAIPLTLNDNGFSIKGLKNL